MSAFNRQNETSGPRSFLTLEFPFWFSRLHTTRMRQMVFGAMERDVTFRPKAWATWTALSNDVRLTVQGA